MGTIATTQIAEKQISDETTVFRAFAAKGFRDRNPPKVKPFAYYRRPTDVDGLSLGITPDASVARLSSNHGYCSISTGSICGLPHGLEIKEDHLDPQHILLCNLPFFNGTDEEREMAAVIAGKLARISTVVTCDSHRPPAESAFPPNY